MKRYLVFFGQAYYPSGGWADFIGDFDDIEEAKRKAEKEVKARGSYVDAWAQVIDTSGKAKGCYILWEYDDMEDNVPIEKCGTMYNQWQNGQWWENP
jgi:hypothetical protein